MGLGGLGERFSSPSGSRQSPAAKCILVHFELKCITFHFTQEFWRGCSKNWGGGLEPLSPIASAATVADCRGKPVKLWTNLNSVLHRKKTSTTLAGLSAESFSKAFASKVNDVRTSTVASPPPHIFDLRAELIRGFDPVDVATVQRLTHKRPTRTVSWTLHQRGLLSSLLTSCLHSSPCSSMHLLLLLFSNDFGEQRCRQRLCNPAKCLWIYNNRRAFRTSDTLGRCCCSTSSSHIAT